jgi:hypothetical protein
MRENHFSFFKAGLVGLPHAKFLEKINEGLSFLQVQGFEIFMNSL